MSLSQIRPFGLLAMIVLLCGPAWAHERPITTPAALFLQGTIERAFGLVRPPISAEAGADLEALIKTSMDWTSLTPFAIGRYGTGLGAEGMDGVTARLEQQLGLLARRAGHELPTMTVAIRDMRIDPDGNRRILSIANVPRFGEVEVEWILATTQTGYRIADIRAFGLTLRQFLRGWVTSLVAARGGDAEAVFGETAAPSPQ